MADSVNTGTSTYQGLAIDANSLNSLKTMSKTNSPEAIKQAAQQFEAIFLNMVMKSMRDATPQYNEFDSEQSKMFVSMLDQEMVQNLSKKGIGLADILEKQLSQGQAKSPEEWEKEGGAKAPSTVTDLHPKANTTLEKLYSNQMQLEQSGQKATSSVSNKVTSASKNTDVKE